MGFKDADLGGNLIPHPSSQLWRDENPSLKALVFPWMFPLHSGSSLVPTDRAGGRGLSQNAGTQPKPGEEGAGEQRKKGIMHIPNSP